MPQTQLPSTQRLTLFHAFMVRWRCHLPCLLQWCDCSVPTTHGSCCSLKFPQPTVTDTDLTKTLMHCIMHGPLVLQPFLSAAVVVSSQTSRPSQQHTATAAGRLPGLPHCLQDRGNSNIAHTSSVNAAVKMRRAMLIRRLVCLRQLSAHYSSDQLTAFCVAQSLLAASLRWEGEATVTTTHHPCQPRLV